MSHKTTDFPLIRVIHPVLTPWSSAQPYFDRIDNAQIYANGGECLNLFETRLAAHFKQDQGCILATSSGTTGLQLAILAQTVPQHPEDMSIKYCLMPSWTFTAVPAAALSAGLRPFFVDVDKTTWSLTPDLAKKALLHAPGKISCVVVVSPFGYPIAPKEWDLFTHETGIPVVIDGAGMFVACEFSNEFSNEFSKTPMVVSLHATKCFGIGEGGFIGTTDRALLYRLKAARQFGMDETRLSACLGTNGKLSEYSAAMGLAQLDAWPSKKEKLKSIATLYARYLSKVSGIRVLPNYGTHWFSGNLVIDFQAPLADKAQLYLQERKIETRFWWRRGCHNQPAYGHCPALPLPTTTILSQSTLGIPFSTFLTEADIQYICHALRDFLIAVSKSEALKSCA